MDGTGPPTDALALGQRVVAVLEAGARTATYKLATLSALVGFCVGHLPADPAAALDVPIDALAERVIDLYWPQVRPFDGHRLRQSSQPKARILTAVEVLRGAANAGGVVGLSIARLRMHDLYREAVAEVALTLAQQPLYRLQRLPGGRGEPFLYDDSWLHSGITRAAIARHGGVIRLFPGVAAALARLSGLLTPTLEILWVQDVRRYNAFLDEDVPDIAGHLFGRDRVSLAKPRVALREAFGTQCFYCATSLSDGNPVDHVLPWSRVPLDGLANLVLACGGCNTDKRDSLPALAHTERALSRDRTVLEQLAADIGWPTQYDRTLAAARGLYRSSPPGTPTWQGRSRTGTWDTVFPPGWVVSTVPETGFT
ncbi:HNH endonuclease [Rhodococcus aetherivorans]